MKALSIQQPWAWAIIAGHKGIENRSWTTSYRGPLLIHAGMTLSSAAYARIIELGRELGFEVPPPGELVRGGIIGRVELVDVVTASRDPWFVEGSYGWVLESPMRLPFRPLTGRLRLFEVEL